MRAYEQTLLRPLFEPWAGRLLDELNVGPGEAFLDVATGPGTVARLAATRVGLRGRVAACDFSPAMLAIASEKPALRDAAPVEYLECPAASMPLPDGAFDVAACQQGLQFFPDPVAGLAEIRRVLKAEGRLGVAVWSSIDRCPPFAMLASAIEAVMGHEVANRYRGGPWGLSEPVELENLITRAGFDQVRVFEAQLPVTFEGGAAQLLASLAASGIASDVASLNEVEFDALKAKAAELLLPLAVDGRVHSETTANIAVAATGS